MVNLVIELGTRLRGGPCRPFTGDGSVETRPGQIRRPDAGVDGGPRDPNGTKAALPKLIVEVLSPSTRDFDTFGKLDEYEAIGAVEHIVLVEPNEPLALVWSRDEASGWIESRARGLDAKIEMPKLGVTLEMAAVYEGVAFPPVRDGSRRKTRPDFSMLRGGDVIVVPFPYSGRLAQKRRPALVVSDPRLHPLGLIRTVMITSAKKAPQPYDFAIPGLARAEATARNKRFIAAGGSISADSLLSRI